MQGKEQEGPIYFPDLYNQERLKEVLEDPPADYQLRVLMLSLVSA